MLPIVLSVILMFFSGYALRKFYSFRNDRVEISLLLVASMCFYYGIGTFLGLVVAPSGLLESMLVDAKLSQADLIWPLALIVVYASFTFAVGRAVCGGFIRRTQLIQVIESVISKRANVWIFFGLCLVEIYLVATGKVAFGGIQTEDVDSFRVSPIALLTMPLAHVCVLVGGYMMYDVTRGFWVKYFFRLVFSTQFIYILLGGRRLAAIALVLAFFGLCLSRVSRLRIWFISAVFLVVFVSSFCLFYALRVAGYSDELRGASKFEMVKGQVSRLDVALTDRSSDLSFSDSLRENISTRPFIIGYFAMLCKGEGAGALGRVFKASVVTAIPSAIWRGKDGALSEGSEELLAYETFGLPRLVDESNTIITSGYTDLIIVGPLIFIIIVMLLIAAGGWVLRVHVSGEIKLIVFSAFFVLCLNLEDSYAAWFVTVRNIAVLSILVFVWNRLTYSRPLQGRSRFNV